MPNDSDPSTHDTAGAWAKKLFFASRALMEAMLRPYDLGTTQWYVLHRLVNQGPAGQSVLGRELEVERATLSAVVSALVRKGFVEQQADPRDQRQKVLAITDAGRALWASLPDPMTLITSVAFDGVDPVALEATRQLLRDASGRLANYKKERLQ